MLIAFTSFEAIFIIERFDDWAGTKSFESTSYWLWAAGFYVLARVEEVADKPIYTWTLHIVSGHTLGHLCAAMVPLCFILMLVKRTRPIQPERHMIVHHQLKLAFMVCLLVPKMIYLWMPKLQVSAIMYEISILMWEFSARYVANQANTSEERGMLETPIRARQIVPRIRGIYGMDIYKNKVLEFLQSERSDESIFGLWGTSGVGKTRLLSLIADSYADSFRHVIFLDGGSSVRVMQNHFAYFLKLDWEAISLLEEHYRAKIIMEYLEHVSFLVLLDDVQDEVYPDLTAVGLPMALGHRQKVILTSRSQVVCARMGCTISNTLEMKCLGDEDAWSLFEYNAGVKITEADNEICEYAKQMVSACGGLPRAICAIGIGVAGATCRGKHPDDWWFTYKRFKGKNLPPERMEEIVPVLV
ncbi:disease resistance protein SUMM2-like [Triticum urartu]|uniref:NB-ARC domain-containing protein n=1 Tax=Triticum urartu TaxID=4572 RepID=A0A8R7QII6_TRIUA|nr:disease resistance protein SUMM2-like [Triticum urartu]XP_048547147.1 disease resistance protein SUMM2-like [Triticum urartu]